MALTGSDWTAIEWYLKHRGWTMRDMMAWPIVKFRDKDDKIVEINIADVKAKYQGRNKTTTKKKQGA